MTPCQITDVQKVLLCIVDGPAFADACDHEQGDYQFTVESCGRKVDVYLYDYLCGVQGLCLRKSDECSDYESGPVSEFIRSMPHASSAEYAALIALLRTNYVRLTPRKTACI